MLIEEVMSLTPGQVVELDKLAGEALDILVNGKPLARGEVVVVDDNFGIRITAIVDLAIVLPQWKQAVQETMSLPIMI